MPFPPNETRTSPLRVKSLSFFAKVTCRIGSLVGRKVEALHGEAIGSNGSCVAWGMDVFVSMLGTTEQLGPPARCSSLTPSLVGRGLQDTGHPYSNLSNLEDLVAIYYMNYVLSKQILGQLQEAGFATEQG